MGIRMSSALAPSLLCDRSALRLIAGQHCAGDMKGADQAHLLLLLLLLSPFHDE